LLARVLLAALTLQVFAQLVLVMPQLVTVFRPLLSIGSGLGTILLILLAILMELLEVFLQSGRVARGSVALDRFPVGVEVLAGLLHVLVVGVQGLPILVHVLVGLIDVVEIVAYRMGFGLFPGPGTFPGLGRPRVTNQSQNQSCREMLRHRMLLRTEL
jgi:hypothetical protein